MRKMPCLFARTFHGHNSATIRNEVTPGCEWVLAGEGTASLKYDGTACMVREGRLYKRYDAKRGKAPPAGWEACGEPDAVTGHNPGWLPVGDEPDSRWHREAWAALECQLPDGTYELVGPKIGANHERQKEHIFLPHGEETVRVERTFDAIRREVEELNAEGLVFAHPDGRMCKIRRNDFGFAWPLKAEAAE